jgi:hypothetical protein
VPADYTRDRVLLERVHWQRLHPPIRRAVYRAVERVRSVRTAILRDAKVAELPPVVVVDHAWALPGPPENIVGGAGIVHGASSVVEINEEFEFGVKLPAPVVMHSSDLMLRGLLLHEFAHCFFSAREALASFDRGIFELKFIPPDPSKLFDRDWDAARLDPPSLWFSDEDVSNFIYQHDAMLGPCSNLVRTEWIAKKRPTIVPELRYSIRGTFSIPSSIIDVIRASASDFQEPAQGKP